METHAFHRGKPYTWIQPSFSTSSLDAGLLASAHEQRSLLSESITFGSLSSKSSDVPPIFCPRVLPTIRTIGLGDRLKMFSCGKSQMNEKSGKHHNQTVVISAPTIPRLKLMFKECLSITKWAESSVAWHAPGHIPWEGVQENTGKHWIPDGSLFSPDCFILALSQSRTSRGIFRPCWGRQCPSEPPAKTQEFQDARSPSQALMPTELLDIVDELKTIRTFFQGPAQDEQIPQANEYSGRLIGSNELHIPALVISNSQFTFPVSLDSYNLSHRDSGSLASRRGKTIPPPLRVKKITKELPYPEIPSAFLGSPSRHYPQFENANLDKAALPFEEMISNLRLQCSTMALETPPLDSSWNSRAFLESESLFHDNCINSQTVDRDEWAFAQSLLDDCKLPPQPRALLAVDSRHLPSAHVQRAVRGTRVSFPSQAHEVKDAETKTAVEAIEAYANSNNSAACDIKNSELAMRQNVMSPAIRPSAIAKRRASYITKPVKRVRFILTHQEAETNTTLEATLEDNTEPEMSDRNEGKRDKPSTPNWMVSKHISRKSFALSRSSSSISTWKRARSATVGSPVRHSVSSKMFPESKVVKSDFDTNVTVVHRSTQSLGRHSLSRIIKGPMFCARDVKRATAISSTLIASEMATDENAVRRGNGTLSAVHKKSRMPVPLRNMLTRFK